MSNPAKAMAPDEGMVTDETPTVKPPRKRASKGASEPKAPNATPIAGATKVPRAAPTFDASTLDQFGFRADTRKSKAAAMYVSDEGATLAEVKKAVGSTQFNVLTALGQKGFEIEKTMVKGNGTRRITRYRAVAKK